MKPENIKLQISLDSLKKDISPCTFSVKPGTYRLVLESVGFTTVYDNINIKKDSDFTKTYTMEHTRAYIDSVSLFQQTRSKKIQWIRRITFGSLAIMAAGGGAYNEKQTRKTLKKYNNLDAKVSQGTFNSTWDSYKTYSLRRNLCYIFSGLCAGGFAVSVPF